MNVKIPKTLMRVYLYLSEQGKLAVERYVGHFYELFEGISDSDNLLLELIRLLPSEAKKKVWQQNWMSKGSPHLNCDDSCIWMMTIQIFGWFEDSIFGMV
jgi:hypothetical protein